MYHLFKKISRSLISQSRKDVNYKKIKMHFFKDSVVIILG